MSFQRRLKRQRVVKVPVKSIKSGPIRHKTLPEALLTRITTLYHQPFVRLVFQDRLSLAAWIEGFLKDTRPDQEVSTWEWMNRLFVLYDEEFGFDKAHLKGVFSVIMSLGAGSEPEKPENFPDHAYNVLVSLAARVPDPEQCRQPVQIRL